VCRYACFAGLGSKSGLATGDLQEGDRDPVTGRLILDPLKIPTAEQGAPGTWEEYLAMRKAKEGGVAKDLQVCCPGWVITCWQLLCISQGPVGRMHATDHDSVCMCAYVRV
jgi:hypothetical protein